MKEIKLKSADELMDECEKLLTDKKTAKEGYKKVENLANNGADMGRLYMKGKYVRKDFKKAFALNMYAANMGNVNGMYNVGMMYKVGLGVKQNFSSAVEWLKKASDAGHEDASVELADYFLDDDEEQAVIYYRRGAKKGNAHAMYVLHQFYRDGLGGLEQDDDKAFELCSQAAELGDVDAIGDMGYCYEDGIGVDQDYAKALEWYLKAGEAGLALGFLNAGYAYSNGRGTELYYGDWLVLQRWCQCEEEFAEGVSIFVYCRLFGRC